MPQSLTQSIPSNALTMLNRSVALLMNRSVASATNSNATMLMTRSVPLHLKRFAVEVRRGNVKLLLTPSMNSNAKLPMKTSAAQSQSKYVRWLQSNSAQLFRIRSVQQLLRSNVAMVANASV